MKNTRTIYSRPEMKAFAVSLRKCIATSVTGSTEGYSNYEYQNEGFDERNQGDF